MSKKDKLVLGSAGRESDEAVTVDIDPDHKPDVVHDLQDVFKELHRVCHCDGTIYIEVPHHEEWCANTPSHKLRFNTFAFDGWCAGNRTWKTGQKFIMLKKEVTFHRAHRKFFLHKIFNKYPMAYERFWTYIFPAEHLKLWLRPQK